MKRRTLLAAAVGVMVAGCLTTDTDDETGGDDAAVANESADTADDEAEVSESATEESSDTEIVAQFESSLEDAGFERVDVEPVEEWLELGYDATGTTEDDVAAEIELIADGFTTAIEQGLSSTHLEATAYDPSDDVVLDYFSIETEWIEAYLSDVLEWRELLTRIAGTFVSVEPVDDDGGGEESDEDEDSEDGGEEESDEGEHDEEEEDGDAETDDGGDDGESDGEEGGDGEGNDGEGDDGESGGEEHSEDDSDQNSDDE